MTTTADVQEALASGDAVLQYIKFEESWYYEAARQPREPWIQQEWSVGINSREGGTYGEWTIMLGNLGEQGRSFRSGPGYPAVQHRIFEDALPALLCVPDYFQVVAAAGNDPEQVEHALIALGFVDATVRTDPHAQPQPRVEMYDGPTGRVAIIDD